MKNKQCNRRDFIRKTVSGTAAVAGVVIFGGLANAQNASGKVNINDSCIMCGACVSSCAVNAIKEKNGTYYVDQNLCTGCKKCIPECPVEAIYYIAG